MTKWVFEPGHTAAEFRVRHMMVTWVRGLIPEVEGTLDLDLSSPIGGVVEVTMDASKLWSGDEARDGHLKAPDFLDAENHPNMTFKGKFASQIGETDYTVDGDLTIRGITRPVSMDVNYLGQWATPFWVGNEDKGPKTRAGFTGTTKFNRHDFDVSWQGEMENGGVVVGDDVFVTVDAEALLED